MHYVYKCVCVRVRIYVYMHICIYGLLIGKKNYHITMCFAKRNSAPNNNETDAGRIQV